MEPNFQSSFIPKDSDTKGVFQNKKTGILGILAVFIFVLSIVAAVGMFIYKGMINNDIQNLNSQLTDAQKNIDKGTIDQMYQFSKKLSVAKDIVVKHQAISNFLDILESSTVSSVGFTDFNYSSLAGGNLTVTMKGKATGYSAVALQENVFSGNKYFKSVSFSNLTLADKGMVSFDLAIMIDPQIFDYSLPVSSSTVPSSPPAIVAVSTSTPVSVSTSTSASVSTSTSKNKK